MTEDRLAQLEKQVDRMKEAHAESTRALLTLRSDLDSLTSVVSDNIEMIFGDARKQQQGVINILPDMSRRLDKLNELTGKLSDDIQRRDEVKEELEKAQEKSRKNLTWWIGVLIAMNTLLTALINWLSRLP